MHGELSSGYHKWLYIDATGKCQSGIYMNFYDASNRLVACGVAVAYVAVAEKKETGDDFFMDAA